MKTPILHRVVELLTSMILILGFKIIKTKPFSALCMTAPETAGHVPDSFLLQEGSLINSIINYFRCTA